MNTCTFSPCRRYRYTLKHRWDDLMPERCVMWVGLNPSTADEQKLDPTLRRIRAFSTAWGFNAFVMTNLFAFRATDPHDMFAVADPVGKDNDEHLRRIAEECQGAVVAAWGVHGKYRERSNAVVGILHSVGSRIRCIGKNADGSPKHPLYVSARAHLISL